MSRLLHPRAAAVALILLVALPGPGRGQPAASVPGPAEPGPSAPGMAQAGGASFPFEVSTPFHVGLFHWLDSLTGTSGGKTIRLYRDEFRARFPQYPPEDSRILKSFQVARVRHARSRLPAPGGRSRERGPAVMLGAFMEEDGLEKAISRLRPEMSDTDEAALRAALDHFLPRYATIWQEAGWLGRFAEGLGSPPTRNRIGAYLEQLARFFGVVASEAPIPRLVLVPVPAGGGTHAQAVGRNLLLEIRPGDGPLDQISVIAHETSHYLFRQIPADRLRRLQAAGRGALPYGVEIWGLLEEALPTALGQGVAQARFHPQRFSVNDSWYHLPEVDRLAKRIYPIVDRAMREGAILDEAMLAAMARAGS